MDREEFIKKARWCVDVIGEENFGEESEFFVKLLMMYCEEHLRSCEND